MPGCLSLSSSPDLAVDDGADWKVDCLLCVRLKTVDARVSLSPDLAVDDGADWKVD